MRRVCFDQNMVLVEYSDSEDDATLDTDEDFPKNQSPNIARPLKRKQRPDESDAETPAKSLPPLPSILHPLYATNVRSGTSDDPALHGGRTRQIPHVEGNWPTHIFLEWMPTKPQLAILDQILEQIKATSKTTKDGFSLQSFLRSELGVQLPLHISLSAPLVLTTQKKDDFKDNLVSAVTNPILDSFTVTPNSLRWVANHDASRWFLILGLGKPKHNQLNRLLQACNRTAQQYGLPELYRDTELVGVTSNAVEIMKSPLEKSNIEVDENGSTDRSAAFHVSIAWSLQSQPTPVSVLENKQQQLSRLLEELGEISFNRVKVKIGNIISDVPLNGE